MDRRVTHSACLILLCLIVERWNSWRCRIDREGVAFEAEQIDVRATEQTRVRRTVRRVASHASFGLHRHVLERERTSFICVAGKANLVLCGGGAKLTSQETTMRVVTVAAIHQTFI